MFLLKSLKSNLNKISLFYRPTSIIRLKHDHSSPSSKIFLNDKYDNFTYNDIFHLSKTLSNNILSNLNKTDLNGEKIAVLCSNNYTYLVSILAIWMSNGVPLGLNKQYPNNLIEYFINDSKCKLVLNGIDTNSQDQSLELDKLLDKYRVVNYKLNENEFYTTKNKINNSSNDSDVLNSFNNLLNTDKNRQAVILYTSGTSGPPKGVVLTCGNIYRTVETIKNAWQINSNDKLLHVLPLNHVHGLIYGLLTFFYSGAQIDMLPKFNADQVWSKLLDENSSEQTRINSFMAVPTIYVQLVNTFLNTEKYREKYPESFVRNVFKNKIRLVVSGSAPLNVKTHKEWNDITGYNILERYGMTEIGLGLSNPYIETNDRKRVAGAVGRPYGNTQVRIVDTSKDDYSNVLVQSGPDNDTILTNDSDLFGELQIKGDMVFKEYLNKPEQTKETFTRDGWFRTGDTAEFLKDLKIYKLIGRTSVDVIKSGGYKISALDIEKEILGHPLIDDVAIMGLSDPVWGQRIFALIVLKQNSTNKFDFDEFKKWCKSRLPKYSVPKVVKIIDKMPRNQLGKVNKKELIKVYEKEFSSSTK